jgi:hypothetical protein
MTPLTLYPDSSCSRRFIQRAADTLPAPEKVPQKEKVGPLCWYAMLTGVQGVRTGEVGVEVVGGLSELMEKEQELGSCSKSSRW